MHALARAALAVVLLSACGGKPAPKPLVTLEGSETPARPTAPITPADPEPSKTPEPRPRSPKPPGPIALIPSSKPTNQKSQAEIAAHLAWEAEQLYAQGKYADATTKLRDAASRVPLARYFYNLCASLYEQGKFSEALTACNAVDKTDEPPPTLTAKAADLMAWIKDEAGRQNLQIQP